VGPDLDVQAAGGIFVQALPEAREEILEMIEKNIFGMGNLSNALVSYPSLEDMLRVIMQGMEYDIVGEQEIGFRCTCSWERLGNIIGKMSADQLALEPECQGLEVVCEFCRERYQYSLQELETLGKK
ncbi:MAG: Hsp33 family molecular chaperone HslO, partial [Syntrophomonadaceae bacterium]|nr:Hsp33 family molecular chaperone HslO [Syntrophomonadaceae bacterium]